MADRQEWIGCVRKGNFTTSGSRRLQRQYPLSGRCVHSSAALADNRPWTITCLSDLHPINEAGAACACFLSTPFFHCFLVSSRALSCQPVISISFHARSSTLSLTTSNRLNTAISLQLFYKSSITASDRHSEISAFPHTILKGYQVAPVQSSNGTAFTAGS